MRTHMSLTSSSSRGFGFIGAVGLVLVAATAATAAPKDAKVKAKAALAEHYKVSAVSGLNVRMGPALKEKKITALVRGTVVKVLTKNPNGWWRVQPSQGPQGWVHSAYLRRSGSEGFRGTKGASGKNGRGGSRSLPASSSRGNATSLPGSGFSKSPATSVWPTSAASANGVAGGAQTLNLIKQFEGFRSSPYWDVNAYRAGYGSDTYTTADGRVHRVTRSSRVSRADAERDLARRAVAFQNTVRRQVGASNFDRLPGSAQAALTSVAYNYGRLPRSVVAAVRTGNLEQIARSVEGLQGHNGGVNRSRRLQEAALIRR